MKNAKALLALVGPLSIVLTATISAAADQPDSADRRLDQALREVAALGAKLYNDGDPAGCYRLFEGALITAQGLLDNRPEAKKAISRGLESARRIPVWEERALRLRQVLDKTREALKPVAQATPPAGIKAAGFKLSDREHTLLDLTNKERDKEGLKPLRPNAKLFKAARLHSANMAKKNQLAHVLDDKKPDERIRDAGYRGITWGENIAAGFPPVKAMDVWMNSEGHRANILNPAYAEVGIGIATNGDGFPFYTMVFGAPFRR